MERTGRKQAGSGSMKIMDRIINTFRAREIIICFYHIFVFDLERGKAYRIKPKGLKDMFMILRSMIF